MPNERQHAKMVHFSDVMIRIQRDPTNSETGPSSFKTGPSSFKTRILKNRDGAAPTITLRDDWPAALRTQYVPGKLSLGTFPSTALRARSQIRGESATDVRPTVWAHLLQNDLG